MRIDPKELSRRTIRELGKFDAVSSSLIGAEFERFGDLINQHFSQSNSYTLDVFPLPTGCGKTTMMVEACRLIIERVTNSQLYSFQSCADFQSEFQTMPGVLIVVKRIKDANEIAQIINDHQNKQYAAAWHSENTVTNPTEIPFLVVTHEKYKRALEASRYQEPQPLDQILNFQMCCRQLTIIDEKIELSQNQQVTLKALRLTVSAIDEFARSRFATEAAYLDKLVKTLTKKSDSSADCQHQIVEMADFDCPPDFAPLIDYLNKQPLDHEFTGRNDIACRKGAAAIVTEALKFSGTMNSECLMLSKIGTDTFLSTTSRIPHRKAIVLDATAEFDFEYVLHAEHVCVHSFENDLRTYQNTTLNVSFGNHTGKNALGQNAVAVASDLYQYLGTSVQPNSKTLVCCHKATLHEFESASLSDVFTESVNYGNIDGRNDWSDFDNVLVVGLSHRDEVSPRLAYMAAHGPQTEEWLNSQRAREQANGHDPIAKLKQSANVTSLVQALNRIKIRRIIDEEGNCAPCNAYLLLGARDGQGGEVLSQVVAAMPNIVVSEFEFDVQATKRKSKTHSRNEKLLSFFGGKRRYGTYSVAEVASEANISRSTMRRIINDLNNEASELSQAANTIGLSYFSSTGRNGSSYFQYEGQ